MMPSLLISYPSPSGFSNASEPFSGLTPLREGSQLHRPLDSHPSGSESPSESIAFGSATDQFATASGDSPYSASKSPLRPTNRTMDHWYSQRFGRPSPSASHSASSARSGSKLQLFPPVKVAPTHRRCSISQPSGMPSPSESWLVGSVLLSMFAYCR